MTFSRIFKSILKPEFIFNPICLLKRILRQRKVTNNSAIIKLPWKSKLKINPKDAIGNCIWRTGIYDLAMTEIIFRLLKPGDLAIDGGANIGYTSSLMSQKVGKNGKVIAFEPHPTIYSRLVDNSKNWQYKNNLKLIQKGISQKCGIAFLDETQNFQTNEGTSRVILNQELASHKKIEIVSLDSIFPSGSKIDFLKLDIEGHEYQALLGAKTLLENQNISNILFEEHFPQQSKVISYLVNLNYKVYFINKAFFGPQLIELKNYIRTDKLQFNSYEPMNFIATVDNNLKSKINSTKGWFSLKLR
jgi:FkbM family methyltransferase